MMMMMMKKGVLFLSVLLILFISVSFVYAGINEHCKSKSSNKPIFCSKANETEACGGPHIGCETQNNKLVAYKETCGCLYGNPLECSANELVSPCLPGQICIIAPFNGELIGDPILGTPKCVANNPIPAPDGEKCKTNNDCDKPEYHRCEKTGNQKNKCSYGGIAVNEKWSCNKANGKCYKSGETSENCLPYKVCSNGECKERSKIPECFNVADECKEGELCISKDECLNSRNGEDTGTKCLEGLRVCCKLPPSDIRVAEENNEEIEEVLLASKKPTIFQRIMSLLDSFFKIR